ncbi:MAG: hypothetical protein KDA32_11000 [Phycisphaerales bacterium]|nr:hypothetical protein [Phycisphaerales bacterium]
MSLTRRLQFALVVCAGILTTAASRAGVPPVNDDCASAIPTAVNSTIYGSTVGAIDDGNTPACDVSLGGHGVWHSFVGNGRMTRISTCDPNTTFDTKVHVYRGSCAALVCVAGNDDSDEPNPDCVIPETGSAANRGSTVNICTLNGVTYYVLVSGFGGATGDYALNISTSGLCFPPANDTCATADTVTCGGAAIALTDFALPDGDPIPSCAFTVSRGLWYRFTATATSAQIDACASDFDTVIGVYSGGCAGLSEIACSDDDCGLQSLAIATGLTIGQTYHVLVGGAVPAERGLISMSITCPAPNGACCLPDGTCIPNLTQTECEDQMAGAYAGDNVDCIAANCPAPPPNDTCEAATAIAIPATVNGTNALAANDPAPECGSFPIGAGVWYEVIGTGTTITATTCFTQTNYDTTLQVYCGDCNELRCVAQNDDPTGTPPECQLAGATRKARVSWCSELGARYLIRVDGFLGEMGTFRLQFSQNGVACAPTSVCLPRGACCDGLSCQILSEPECAAVGGAYAGDNTTCGGLVYPTAFENCASPFEDISGSGTLAAFASAGDDRAEEIPIGFAFDFYEEQFTTVWVTSNGLMVFPPSIESDADDFTNDPIPSPIIPNRIIAVLWDDMTTLDANSNIFYETVGTAPNRRLIVQWDGVNQFDVLAPMLFQATLSESDSAIELRYVALDTPNGEGDWTIGLEDGAGVRGVSIPQNQVVDGVCKRIVPTRFSSACCPDVDGSGMVDLADLAGLLAAFGSSQGSPQYLPGADVDQNGTINLSDLAGLLAAFGSVCP